MLTNEGWVITNTKPFNNIPNYPEVDKLMAEINALPRHIAIDADQIAVDLGSPKSANIVILGAASPFLGLEIKQLENAIRFIFGKKGEEIVNINLNALAAGRKFALENQ